MIIRIPNSTSHTWQPYYSPMMYAFRHTFTHVARHNTSPRASGWIHQSGEYKHSPYIHLMLYYIGMHKSLLSFCARLLDPIFCVRHPAWTHCSNGKCYVHREAVQREREKVSESERWRWTAGASRVEGHLIPRQYQATIFIQNLTAVQRIPVAF